MLMDVFYAAFGLSARAVAGSATEAIPHELALACAIVLLLLTLFSLGQKIRIRRTPDATGPLNDRPSGVSILPHPGAAGQPPKGPS